jgi:glycosyltransferase involved in cell wall biosynthesis
VVSTHAGNSGIRASSGKQIWVEDDPEAFAGRVVTLLRGEGWRTLSEEGRQLVEKTFSWERSAAALEAHIAAVRASYDRRN